MIYDKKYCRVFFSSSFYCKQVRYSYSSFFPSPIPGTYSDKTNILSNCKHVVLYSLIWYDTPSDIVINSRKPSSGYLLKRNKERGGGG